MSSLVTPELPHSKTRRLKGSARAFGRHQLSALITTCADFSTMTLCHELLGFSTVQATVMGATVGGFVNFELGRSWVFRAKADSLWPQALRYAAVSLGCIVLNAIGMALLHRGLGAEAYVIQRAAVSFLVSIFWSFPAQRFLVFKARG